MAQLDFINEQIHLYRIQEKWKTQFSMRSNYFFLNT